MKTDNRGKVMNKASSRQDRIKRRLITGTVMSLAMVVLLSLAACEGHENDPVAPEGSTITVSASPQTVIIPTGGGSGISLITATLRSSNGVRLPDQEITFSTTSGTMNPPAQTPLKTDDQGLARATLTTSQSATVTATSGNITAETQVQTASGDISTITLDVVPQELTTCSDQLSLEATVRSSNGDPVSGVVMVFNETGDSTVDGTFTPPSQVTDVAGMAAVMWIPSTVQCPSACTAALDPNGSGICVLAMESSDVAGTAFSNRVDISDNIP